jgi:hypothetical protein
MNLKYTSKPARWTGDGESYLQFHLLENASAYDDRDLKDEFAFRCFHIHDCCGCVSSGIHRTRPLSGDRLAIVTYGWRNI